MVEKKNIIRRTLDRWKEARQEKWLKKLERGIDMLKNRIEFDPRLAFDIHQINSTQNYTTRLTEYLAWGKGNATILRELYRSSSTGKTLNYFWAKAPNNYRMLHTGIPGLIATKQKTILFGSGVETIATVFDDKNEIDDNRTKELQEYIDFLEEKIKIQENREKAAVLESITGHCFFKFSHNTDLSQYPILEVCDQTQARVEKERGITTAIIFQYWYDKKKDAQNKNEVKDKYRLDEIYTTNGKGDAVIAYRLYKMNTDGSEKIVDLESIAETMGLRETFKLDEYDAIVYEGLQGMLAFEKPNKTPSREFNEIDYGASDFEGAIDSFDALDEAYSELIAEIRSNKTIRYIPSTMLQKIEISGRGGERQIRTLMPNEFITNYQMTEGDQDQNAKNEINIQQIKDKTEEHLAKYRAALTTAINLAGMSPLALGITGLESVVASAESQQERNKATLETRSSKLQLWETFNNKVMMQALIFNSWLQKNAGAIQLDGFNEIDLNQTNLSIKTTFGDFIIEREKDRINTWGIAKQMGVASTKTAIEKIRKELSPDEVDKEVNLIRYEQGMSLDNPMNLPNLTGMEEVIENENKQEEQDEV